MQNKLHSLRAGRGRPLLLIHGLGGSWQSWATVVDGLARDREVVAFDLPGHGDSAAEPDSGTFQGLVRSVEAFLAEEKLEGVDVVGSSLGARLALELARKGKVGAVVALDPGGFWEGGERTFFKLTLNASVGLLRGVKGGLRGLSRNPVSRSVLLAQLSAKPWALDPDRVATELQGYVETKTFDALVKDLAEGPEQQGPAAAPSEKILIGWGRHDRLCLRRQAKRALSAFPGARLHWFEKSGHFPMWDQPEETVRVILGHVGATPVA